MGSSLAHATLNLTSLLEERKRTEADQSIILQPSILLKYFVSYILAEK